MPISLRVDWVIAGLVSLRQRGRCQRAGEVVPVPAAKDTILAPSATEHTATVAAPARSAEARPHLALLPWRCSSSHGGGRRRDAADRVPGCRSPSGSRSPAPSRRCPMPTGRPSSRPTSRFRRACRTPGWGSRSSSSSSGGSGCTASSAGSSASPSPCRSSSSWCSAGSRGTWRRRSPGCSCSAACRGRSAGGWCPPGSAKLTSVSQYRLAAHLSAASLLFVALIWVARRLEPRQTPQAAPVWPVCCCSSCSLLQIVAGAFVAGLDAGMGYNTWPLMDGALVPAGLDVMTPWWKNLFENALTVQFNHRVIAYVVVAYARLAAWRQRARRLRRRVWLAAADRAAGPAAGGAGHRHPALLGADLAGARPPGAGLHAGRRR